jgi:hypothetical protein
MTSYAKFIVVPGCTCPICTFRRQENERAEAQERANLQPAGGMEPTQGSTDDETEA